MTTFDADRFILTVCDRRLLLFMSTDDVGCNTLEVESSVDADGGGGRIGSMRDEDDDEDDDDVADVLGPMFGDDMLTLLIDTIFRRSSLLSLLASLLKGES